MPFYNRLYFYGEEGDWEASSYQSATLLQLAIAPKAECPYYPRMILKKFMQVCSEELLKAKRAIVSAYGAIREADERTMDFLMMFLGIR